jgi:AcrR family transcriptional regulator
MATETPRLPLTRDRILETALALVDEHGIEALSMRKLGRALGFEAMSLYNHVENKDDVVNGIVDLVLAEGQPPAPDGDWDHAVRASALSVHQAFKTHPWACQLVMSPGHVRPARLRYMDSLLGRLREAGFSADATYHAYHVLDAHIFGFSMWQASHSYTPEEITGFVEIFERMIPADEYPHLNEHARQHLTEGPHQDVSAFELGLDLILAGLREMRARESEAPA